MFALGLLFGHNWGQRSMLAKARALAADKQAECESVLQRREALHEEHVRQIHESYGELCR